MNYQDIFKRYEKKYLLSPQQYDELLLNIPAHMENDTYGIYRVSNLYYDTQDFSLIRKSILKPVFKEKFRVRHYTGDHCAENTLFLELKKKYKGIVYKRRLALAYDDALQYLRTQNADHPKQIMKEIDWFLHYHNPYPRAFISYDRRAMCGKEDPELRLTFDYNVHCRHTDLFSFEDPCGQAIIPEGMVLLEIKTPYAIPLWMTRLFTELNIYPRSFSKYGEYYKQHLNKENTGGISHAG